MSDAAKPHDGLDDDDIQYLSPSERAALAADDGDAVDDRANGVDVAEAGTDEPVLDADADTQQKDPEQTQQDTPAENS